MLLIAYPTYAAMSNVQLSLVNAKTGGPVSDILASIDINGAFLTNNYIGKNSTVDLFLSNGTYLVEFRVEDLKTPGKDYYAKETLEVDKSLTREIVIFPVGTISGVVVDIKGNPAADADLNFECSDIVKPFPEKTDKFGFFTATYVSEGKCIVFANDINNTGRVDVYVERGSLNEIKIRLIKEKINSYYLLIAALIVLIIIIFLIIKKKSVKKETKKRKTELKKNKPLKKEHKVVAAESNAELNKTESRTSERSQDIIKTLGDKEKSAVDFLLKNNNKSNQAAIRHTTGLPRTTLARVLSRLESRKVVQIEKEGKAIRVSLTNWFLGKE